MWMSIKKYLTKHNTVMLMRMKFILLEDVMPDYDVIVIGAGNAGLSAGAKLAKEGASVLLLERHNIPGGCATSFCRGRFEFEIALHQLSGIGTKKMPGPLSSVLDSIDVLNKVEFIEMKDLYRVIVPEKLDITLRPDRSAAIEELQKQFPKEKEAIGEFFTLVYDFFKEVISAFYFKDPEVSKEKYPLFFKYSLVDSQQILDKFFKDPFLKLTLGAYWTYMGVPPSKLPFIDFAALLFVYIEFKPFHVRGGSQALSNAMADTIIENGGSIKYNTGVEEIIVKNNEVKGVRTEDGQEITSKFVISNASKVATYSDLIKNEHVPESVINELKGLSIGTSAFTVYLGMDCKPDELNINESTNFIFTETDMDKQYNRMSSYDFESVNMLLTCFDVISPDFSPEGCSQAALVALQYGDHWLKVPPEKYVETKYKCADQMLKGAEKIYPGLKEHIEEIEIATPLTHLRYLAHPRGTIYGFDSLAKNSSMFIPAKSVIKGLFLAGASVGSGGFQPTIESGISAARIVLKKLSS